MEIALIFYGVLGSWDRYRKQPWSHKKLNETGFSKEDLVSVWKMEGGKFFIRDEGLVGNSLLYKRPMRADN